MVEPERVGLSEQIVRAPAVEGTLLLVIGSWVSLYAVLTNGIMQFRFE